MLVSLTQSFFKNMCIKTPIAYTCTIPKAYQLKLINILQQK